jgi:hypothetical protein
MSRICGFTASSRGNVRVRKGIVKDREGIVKGIADDELAHAAAIDGIGCRGIGGNSLGARAACAI